jgi:hypothetical protein
MVWCAVLHALRLRRALGPDSRQQAADSGDSSSRKQGPVKHDVTDVMVLSVSRCAAAVLHRCCVGYA